MSSLKEIEENIEAMISHKFTEDSDGARIFGYYVVLDLCVAAYVKGMRDVLANIRRDIKTP